MSGRWWSVGSILAALAGAICCLGPLLFAALGLSTFVSLWILRHLVPYQQVFFGVTFVLLGLGFYATYRRGSQTRGIDKAIIWISTALVVGLLGYSLYVERFAFL
jgi:hypothetical protein